jgi:hypothetical protein
MRRRRSIASFRRRRTPSTPTSPFTPGALPGLALWYDAAALSLADGAAVAAWPDRSGGGHDATVAGTGHPTYRRGGGPNGTPCLAFDGSPNALAVPAAALSGLAAGEVWIVLRDAADPPADGTRSCPYGLGSSLAFSHIPFSNGLIYDDFGSTARKGAIAYPAGALAQWSIYSATSAPGLWSNRLAGVPLSATTDNAVGWSPAPQIGCSVSPSLTSYTGRIAEFVLLGRVATEAEEAAMTSYFHSQYGL